MKVEAAIPREMRHTWIPSAERHPPGLRVGYHYHDAEEWLEVVQGEMTFITPGNQGYRVGVGEAFSVPGGEVHRVEIGLDGVQYQMWLPAPMSDGPFAHHLAAQQIDLMRKNLDFPRREEAGDIAFFEGILSERLTFCGVDGVVLDKKGFIGRGFARRGRKTSGSVRVLNNKPGSLLLSTIVTVPEVDASRSFTNVRLFAAEQSGWKCRVWMNYQELSPIVHPESQ
jgi:hypothetical protein